MTSSLGARNAWRWRSTRHTGCARRPGRAPLAVRLADLTLALVALLWRR
jgi:hypothetical protein